MIQTTEKWLNHVFRLFVLAIIFLLYFQLPLFSQVPVIDTVCVSNSITNYAVTGTSGNSFEWKISGGKIISGQGSDSIAVLWDSGPGKYLLEVIESNSYGCSDTSSGWVFVADSAYLFLQVPDTVCEGETVACFARGSGDVHWSNSHTGDTLLIIPENSMNIIASVHGPCGSISKSASINVFSKPRASFIYDPQLPHTGEQINLYADPEMLGDIAWTADGVFISDSSTTAFYTDRRGPLQIGLSVSNQFGCSDSLFKMIQVLENVDLWIPNAFTPNGDGLNDFFQILSSDDQILYRIYIYNRWGNLIYESANITRPWDGTYRGKICPVGIYNYKIIFSPLTEGVPGMAHQRTGSIMLLR